MPEVYVLKSLKVDNWHYVGSCNVFSERFKQHKKGSVRSTKDKRPLELIYKEYYNTITEARRRELFLKSPKGYLEKRRIIKNYPKGITS